MSGRIKKPSEVFIAPFNYKISWNKAKVGTEDYGETDTDEKKINITSMGNDEVERSVLLHECLHALLEDLIKVILKHEHSDADEAEETFIRLLEPRLLQFIQENTDVIEYIKGDS